VQSLAGYPGIDQVGPIGEDLLHGLCVMIEDRSEELMRVGYGHGFLLLPFR
jgi:hypothetical protein